MRIKRYNENRENDPYNEEDWDDDYDIIIDEHGLLAKHIKGKDYNHGWAWDVDMPECSKYIRETQYFEGVINPKDNFHVGVYVGMTMLEAYIKLKK